MPDFSKTRGFSGARGEGRLTIREERQFTNPHIRFVRIRGRIVPIINKKRVGQSASVAGNSMITAGAVLATLGVVKKVAKSKIMAGIKANPRNAAIFKQFKAKAASEAAANATMHKNLRTAGIASSGKRSRLTKIAVGTFKLGAKILRNPLKVGAGLAVTGVAAKSVGFELQTRSPFGADL